MSRSDSTETAAIWCNVCKTYVTLSGRKDSVTGAVHITPAVVKAHRAKH